MQSEKTIIKTIVIISIILLKSSECKKRNNACNKFEDYINVDSNPNCFYNEDMSMDTPQLIKKYTGNVEAHKITTEDGYILTLFRIPKAHRKGVALLQHPLGTNSRIYVGQGNESLAFYLWHHGYEVWLNNMRGTQFSTKHQTLTYTDHAYWNFSLHEIGYYDISAQLKRIANVTNGEKVWLFGHSLGTTTSLIYGSARAKEAREFVKHFVLLGTGCTYKYNSNALTVVARFEQDINNLVEKLRLDNALFFLPAFNQILKMVLRTFPILIYIAYIGSMFSVGYSEVTDPAQFNLDATIYFQTASWHVLTHFLQLMKARTRFQAYDYGKEENKAIYGTTKPPAYPIANFSIPVLFVSGIEDVLTTKLDADYLIDEVFPKKLKTKHISIEGFNHNDFALAKNRKDLFYDEMLTYLESNDI